MLVLMRKKSEMIQIGEDIVIKVIQTGPGTVKLGIQAPKNVRVLRAELCHPAPGSTLAQILEQRHDFLLKSVTETPVTASTVQSVRHCAL